MFRHDYINHANQFGSHLSILYGVAFRLDGLDPTSFAGVRTRFLVGRLTLSFSSTKRTLLFFCIESHSLLVAIIRESSSSCCFWIGNRPWIRTSPNGYSRTACLRILVLVKEVARTFRSDCVISLGGAKILCALLLRRFVTNCDTRLGLYLF